MATENLALDGLVLTASHMRQTVSSSKGVLIGLHKNLDLSPSINPAGMSVPHVLHVFSSNAPLNPGFAHLRLILKIPA